MKNLKPLWLPISLAAAGLLALLIWLVPHTAEEEYAVFDPAFEELITAYTAGQVSRTSSIKVRFTEDMATPQELGQALSDIPFSFSPDIAGKAYWEDTRTLVFKPEGILPSAEIYRVDLALARMNPSIPKELHTFRFRFGTLPQDMKVELTRTRMLGSGLQQVQGIVRTVDYTESEELERTLGAELNRKGLRIQWDHDADARTHRFTIDSIPRTEEDQALTLSWDGEAIGSHTEGEQEIEIPSKGAFRHMHTYAYADPEPYVVVEFSSPLARTQDLTGLVSLATSPVRFLIEENRIKIYPQKPLSGPTQLRIEKGVETESGDQLLLPIQEEVVFSEVKPEVRLIGKGTILPKSESMPLVFEAIGLTAVDVRVIKIFEDNIPQFLQVNRLSENQQLKRVGQPIIQKRIDLGANSELDLNQWNRHSLDLASLIETDPGAIYEVSIGFRPSYAFYNCREDNAVDDIDMLAVSDDWFVYTEESESSYWDYWSYNYDDRQDPCKAAYYTKDKIVRRNILASDLGLIAKSGANGAFFAVTDIQTTQPLSGVRLEVYDYQQQLITTLETGQNGTVRGNLERPPFLLIAKKGNQRGYLRMDDGAALSMSRFDTRGTTYYKGVKGMLYAERGVWRPGDPLFINFILEDKEGVLPASHPVNFELVDPRGNVVERIVQTQGTGGFYTFHTATAPTALTGNYTGRVRVGGATFTKTFKIETIIPNRMKLGLDFGVEMLSSSTRTLQADLTARWLHGAIAKSLKADVRAFLQPVSTQFGRYQDFIFDDPVRKFEAEEISLFDGRLDETGTARVPAKISASGKAPGMLQANFVAKVYEAGGAFSVDRFSMPFSPYPTYVGLKAPKGDAARNMLLTDTDHSVQVVTVDAQGNPVSSEVQVTLYKLSWKWWWDQSEDNIGNYQGEVNAQQIDQATVTTSGGTGTYKMNVAYPQWGRFLIRAVDANGHATGQIVYIDWPGWAGRSTDNQRDGAQMLNFTAEKQTYSVGESITLNIPTGAAGRALVSIENGTKVLETHWVDATKGTTRFSFEAKASMTPNIYVNITLLQPHAQTKNDLPIRMYGVIPLRVENPETHLQPQIAMADEIKPNSNYQVQVSEATGQPMTYTLAVVDEGLLGLTRYHTPDPWQTFYQRMALDVKSWDIFDDVLGAYGGEVKSLLSIGGGAGEAGPAGKKPDRFKPVVEFLGPFTLKPGQTATHSLDMPNYIGEVRAMVVAGDPRKGAYGAAETSAKVKQPLMVLGTLPRVVGPGERVMLPVTVFALDDNISVVNVELQVGKQMLVEGRPRQVVRFYEQGEKMTAFEVGVLSSLGKTPITITASSNGQTAVYETDIEVRTPNPRVTDVFAKSVQAGQSWQQPLKPIGMPGTQEGVLEVSSIPPLNLGGRLPYLIHYPYGCIEQTTSGAFPQVYLTQLMDLAKGQKQEIERNVQAGINRLKLFQTPNGGLAYWPGQAEVSDWGTNYAGHFILEAQKVGFSPDGTFLANWTTYQRKRARDYSGGERVDELNQGYRLYLLAMAGKPEMGAMNRFRRRGTPDLVAQWYLAGAYQLAGQPEVARQLVNGLGTNVPNYQEMAGTYGSTLRDQGIILGIMSEMGMDDAAMPLVNLLSEKLNTENWYSTQTTAYCLVAMAKYVGAGGTSSGVSFAYRLNGGKWQEVKSDAPLSQVTLADLRAGKLEFKNKGKGTLFPRLLVSGIPIEGDTSSASNGLSLSVSYTTLNEDPLDPTEIEQGTDFLVQVTVQNTGYRDYEELALNQIFPSGWEILNSRLDGMGQLYQYDESIYRDIRDDRVYTFFDLAKGKSRTFEIVVNAAYQGTYYLPTISAEAMYDHGINARQGGRWVKVVAPGQGG